MENKWGFFCEQYDKLTNLLSEQLDKSGSGALAKCRTY